jgi:D-ribose pyranose/furanose isomerase RbsD
MIKGQASPEADRASKAEMYFRLAAAFGAPTRTGSFGENLALASGELAEVAAGKRKSAADRFARELELQKTRMEMAGSEVDALRSAARSGAADQRAIAEKLIEQSLAAGKPLSPEGKAALDMGLKAGTPEFYAKVAELTEMKSKSNLAAAAMMSPTAARMMDDTEKSLARIDEAMATVKEAYDRNKNSFSGNPLEQAQFFALSNAGSTDERVINTGILKILLSEQAITTLKDSFGGNPTEGERQAALALTGADALSLREREEIILRLYEKFKARREQTQRKLDAIRSGEYFMYQPETGEE